MENVLARKLVLSGINGEYLRDLLRDAEGETERVDAAVAYASDASLLFDWAWEHKIPLKYWGRFDETLPVSGPILESFLSRASPSFACRLVRKLHAKVIWWRGFGAYIGSANLSGPAWWSNVEAGVFISEPELADCGHAVDLEEMFRRLDQFGSPLTKELFEAIQRRRAQLSKIALDDKKSRAEFLSLVQVVPWEGLTAESAATAKEKRKAEFIREWNSTLQDMRDLATRLSSEAAKPRWLRADVPQGALADQFLHAHYYRHRLQLNRARVEELFEANRRDPEAAVNAAQEWWSAQPQPPSSEDVTLNEWAPFLRDMLSKQRLQDLGESDLIEVFSRVHAIREYARRVANSDVGLPSDRVYSIDEKAVALARMVHRGRSTSGLTAMETLFYIFYGGSMADLPVRLWEAQMDPKYKVNGLGISALGELVGWALPDDFPPRNGRTSKALRSLGYNVKVHV